VTVEKTLAYYKICPFSENNGSDMFYSTGLCDGNPNASFFKLKNGPKKLEYYNCQRREKHRENQRKKERDRSRKKKGDREKTKT
jgi:hypothetical protein